MQKKNPAIVLGILVTIMVGAMGIAITVALAPEPETAISRLKEIVSFKVFFTKIPIVYFMLVILLCVIICLFIALRRYKNRKRVFIVVSSRFTTDPFFAELLKHLTTGLWDSNFVPEIKITQIDPKTNKVPPEEIKKVLKFVSANKHLYSGGFVVHANIDDLYNVKGYEEFINGFKKPIVFLDTSTSGTRNEFPSNIAFIGYDNGEIGDIAAQRIGKILLYLKTKFTQLENNPLRILVIASQEHIQRQDRFKKRIEEIFVTRDNIIVIIDNEGAFKKIDAHRRTYHNINESKRDDTLNDKKPKWDAIFCTNDEMALGAVSALDNMDSDKYSADIKGTFIVGVDATDAATDVIEQKNTPFVSTVNQSPKNLAKEGIDAFFKLRKNEPVNNSLIKPTLYPQDAEITQVLEEFCRTLEKK